MNAIYRAPIGALSFAVLMAVGSGFAIGYAAFSPLRQTASGDFVCSQDGGDTVIIESADAIVRNGNTWTVKTETMRYVYRQRVGEICAVESTP